MEDNINHHQPYQNQSQNSQQQSQHDQPQQQQSSKPDIKLYSTSKIEDYKQEKIAFVIDMYDEITNEDFISLSGDKKLTRLDVIIDEILNFAKLKDYFSPKTEFALYTYTSSFKREIKFSQVNNFISRINTFQSADKDQLATGESYLDLTEIYNEAISYMQSSLSIDSFANSKNNDNNTIIRFIMFYNRSSISPISSNKNDYNLFTFLRLSNFIFDIIFIRRKIINEEDKKTLTNTYNYFAMHKPPSWYLFNNGCNLHNLKYIMNLLLANPNQRVKFANTEKYQKKIDDLIKHFSDN